MKGVARNHLRLLVLGFVLVGLAKGCQETVPYSTDTNAPSLIDLSDVTFTLPGENDPAKVWTDPQGPSLEGGFVDISPKSLPANFAVDAGDPSQEELADLVGGFLADLDNDGLMEVVYGVQYCCDADAKAQVFRYDPMTQELSHDPELSGTVQTLWGMASAGIDVDGDGTVDLIGANRQDFLSWGNEDGSFSPPVPAPGDPGQQDLHTHQGSLTFHDLDQDGWLDILLTDHTCLDDSVIFRPLLREGPRLFTERLDLVDHTDETGAAYAVMAFDTNDGNTLLASIGQPCSNAYPNTGFMKSTRDPSDGYPRFAPDDPTPQESVYKAFPGVSFGPITLLRPMGATRADFNNDGEEDLVISLVEYYALFEQVGTPPFIDRTDDTTLALPFSTTSNHMLPWGLLSVDLDRDGREDLLIAHGDDGTSFLEASQYIGPQDVRAVWNAGDFEFHAFQDQEFLNIEGNWRSLTVGDLEEDGDPDVIIGGFGVPPRVLVNQVDNGNQSLSLRLHGTTSNHLGIGAKVRLVEADGTLGPVHPVGKHSNPMFVSEPLTFLGLGTASKAHAIEITWPSGFVQRVEDLEAGKLHNLTEPPTLSISESDRTLEANGTDEVTIVVTPRHPDGSLRTAPVEIALLAGTGEFIGPTTETEEGWERTLRAPTTAGSAVIEATIDGAAIRVRPRIWWRQP